MSKNVFKVLEGMLNHDIENDTKYVAVSPSLISADKCKGGAKVSMGVDEESLFRIMNNEVFPLLILIDKEEYMRRR